MVDSLGRCISHLLLSSLSKKNCYLQKAQIDLSKKESGPI
jgi:hypothetical protein